MINISGYKVIKKIGSGGMGDVYLAEHEKLEKNVAIKSLHKNLATDPNFRQRFTQEAKTHSKLDHPNIIKLLDYKEKEEDLYLIMEYFDGIQLDDHINQVSGPIPENELTSLFAQILDAIGYAHDEGLVHRDIKPSNIMIDKKGKIKVLDFGIAKLQEEEQGLTKTGVQIGTATYMSPEQVNAEKLCKLSDIYSLGVTLFYMSVGKSPYNAETNSFKIQTQIINNELPKASEIYPGVSSKIEDIIAKSTKKEKSLRYQSCIDFKKDLLTSKIKSNIVIDKNLKYDEKPKRKIITIRNIFFLFLFGLCTFLYLNPQHIPFSNFHEPTKKDFKEFLSSYYNILEKQDYGDFNKFYQKRVNKWFNEDDISLEDIIIKSTDYHNKYLFQEHLVNWQTLKIDDLNGKYLLSYELFYKCKKIENDEWLKWDLNIKMILNEKMKIYSLQETKRKKIENRTNIINEKNIDKAKKEIKVTSPVNIYGDSNITQEGKISGQQLIDILSKNDSVQVKVEAVINSICQTKGCWMYVDLNEETEMLVRFKDYGFFVPIDASGNTAIIEGMAKVDTLSVEWLKHLKEDANAPQEEIDAITEPQIMYSMAEATGVIIK